MLLSVPRGQVRGPSVTLSAMPMTTTSEVLRMLADGDYRIIRSFTGGLALHQFSLVNSR
jgi:hypothetical protein